ncbi:Family 16 glycosylhydrolase [Rhodovastum atsumiense]|uniref:Family 16 glycosylhydrolase n=1 Tax=Rhodovastum atsumiense TaxID=504468 RepID=A0A5M6J2Q2_9PROT|nr:family 16 glycosylhydrolase [Rhodovastum atsumiense]KAA5613878.1 family 16 glycosylhydrolase [Rhodovastum atsumiense]CAH2602002.1 Family 16 glycosylhydrolase [Rhodovastum atsumiense]
MTTSATTGNIVPSTDNAPGLRQVFFDGFDGTSLDRANWPTLYGGDGLSSNGAFRFDPGKLSVGNGVLTISGDKGGDGIWNVGGLSTAPWAGAAAGTGTGITYGRVEIRAKLGWELKGAGAVFLLWPTTPNVWPPEVDILETPNGKGMFTVHWAGPSGEDKYRSQLFDLDLTQWHTYTTDWTPDGVRLYIDDTLICTETNHVPSQAMSVGLQGHVGAASELWYGGSPNASGVKHFGIEVGYVSMAQWIGGTLTPPGDPIPPPPPPVAMTIGSGPHMLVFKISEDAFQGDAQYTIKVDGQQVGGTFAAKALHSYGQSDTIILKGDWGLGSHRVEMAFLEDAWGGIGTLDRNLYLDAASYDGVRIPDSTLAFRRTGTQSLGFTDWSPLTMGAGEIAQGTDGLDIFRCSDVAGSGLIKDFQIGIDKLVFSGVDAASVRISDGHGGADNAWGQRVTFGTHGESVFLRWSWGVTTADMRFT